jgi:penicillin-binding protein 2
MKKLLIKNHHKETRLFQNRCIAMGLFTLLIISIILGRLLYLQVVEHRFYTTLSQQNLLEIIPLPPKRGLIYDRNGILLAKNIPVYTLDVTPEKTPHLAKTLKILQSIMPISGTDITQFQQARKQHRPFDPVPLKFKLSEQEVDQFYVNRYRLQGVSIQAGVMRDYPLAGITSDVVGYVGRITAADEQRISAENYSDTNYIGKAGIEESFEKALHGTVGSEEAEIAANGHIVRILKETPPLSGKALYLTINSKIQAAAEKAMGTKTGAIVVVQPATGQILALVTNPTYNPNPFVRGLTQKAYDTIVNAPGHPLINRSTLGQFAPGSTIKPFYAVEGLDTHTITPDYRIFDPGWFRIPHTRHIFHDWQPQGHGWVNYAKAIIVSCDTYFYNLAVKLGIVRMDTVLHEFGFGSRTGIALTHESTGLAPTPYWKLGATGHPWYTGDTVNAGIGQGYVLATPLQLAMATATLSEHGKRFVPELILKTQQQGRPSVMQKPIEEAPILLKHNWVWNDVIHAMEGVVKNLHGTGFRFGRHAPYTVAAKTGTAQVYGHNRNEYAVRTDIPKKLRNNELFISFAPVNHPQIAVAVVIEHDGNASAIARKVMDSYFEPTLPKDAAHDAKRIST